VDISVLVRDLRTGEWVPDAKIWIQTCNSSGEKITGEASRAMATNKLFQAVELELPEPGTWQVEVIMEAGQGRARVSFSLEVEPPLPRWQTLWPWAALPFGVIVVFCLQQFLARRRGSRESKPQRARANGEHPV
jgi:hypothetical protein